MLKTTRLSIQYPHLAKEWLSQKNGNLQLDQFSHGSGKKVWWQCEKGHEWEAQIRKRVQGQGCPYCANQKVWVGFNDLATHHPELTEQWHPIKNDTLTPEDVVHRSNKKVWWRCSKNHEWEAEISDRVKGGGCPYCGNKKVLSGFNDLATINPELAKEWDLERNHPLTPSDVLPGCGKKVWWTCNCNHYWDATIYHRSNGTGCPYCANQKIWKGDNDLATTRPDLAKEWHPIKNGDLTSNQVNEGSNKNVWWQCEKGHEWPSLISNRSKGNGCPYCSGLYAIKGETDLATISPHIAKEWHPTKNGDLMPFDVKPFSNQKVWWQCEKGHEWETTIANRSEGSNCPQCVIRGTSFPEQALFYYLSKLFPMTENRHEFELENKKLEVDIYIPELNLAIEYDGVYWHQQKEASDRAKSLALAPVTTLVRIREQGLPLIESDYCIFTVTSRPALERAFQTLFKFINTTYSLEEDVKKASQTFSINLKQDELEIMENYRFNIEKTSIVETSKRLVQEWHPKKNGNLQPDSFSPFSNQKVWWRCHRGHEWQATIANRSRRGDNCPYCSGRYAIKGETDLATTHPDLAKEWHFTKNETLTPHDISAGSNQKVWWQCSKNHEWEATPNARSGTNPNNCPYCANQKIWVGYNDLATTHPHLAQEWHPSLNGTLTPQMVSRGSGKKVWWLGECGHEWPAKIQNRSIRGDRCPHCSKNSRKKRNKNYY